MNQMSPVNVTANGRSYAWPRVPAIAICLDGCEPAYLDEAIEAGLMPALERIKKKGTVRFAHSVIPSFTNPNNLSIATGRPPAVHGICGNYLYNPETGEEVMMNDPKFLRAPTIFQAFCDAGAKVAVVTAKDKLRALLGKGLKFDDGRAMCFSAERSDTTTKAEHGIDNASKHFGLAVPEVYSAELSEFVFAAGVQLLKEFRPDVMYLTTTDYVQHKYAPGVPQANAFYEMFDKYLVELDAQGAAIVVTADHGMKPKHHADGSPNVVYVQDLLDEWLGKDAARVILPITDPYVVHHGALGSFATAYLPKGADREAIMAKLRKVEGIILVLGREEGSARFELPEDRMGDIILISGENKTIGTSEHRHNLAALDEPLRSHGGLTEQEVPFIVNRVLADLPNEPVLRNFDAFFYATMAAAQA
ncbi:phosphonoacetate hydrolase [Mesorhizobium sp. M2D.F.Ca.ET.185.01.1.1]|uniref:phosphonoacetate hydrolase n=5 Tax=Mesorhizobium TaxID=68287 RepID=UPI000FCAEB64|nr:MULTISPECIES: phosphonoacetate hydrolase [unclassified Mesorhizobium]TGP80583.1 phosphonoacetate hydrolase [bacterium M00.F.Ca.ET.227.01.1.1]TGQ00447.1 phosphonoacetate hydrolase [bacterium M00.F.Ca.ET.221.01.1.1]TGQ03029.1 phosphonoacetate hydrolase [bacterium M00.F.Ca.ET.222.01.1.1]TGT74291.1 phosphonoacetate hydrolase [bacterium M00.F.Ca.ET.159.01.1.1]TGT86541.1 phosphonoacetate hydrolase [bacterium M00.F.Ca.ET.157.01.1.1]TGU09421.1 phosphonoacetate hydrolase [bacterium M00.F.Ca.ET.163.